MTARGFYLLLFGSLMLFTALSVGSSGAFLLGAAALFCWALSLLCVCLAAFSCRVEQSVEGGQAARGGACRFHLRVRFGLPAVIAPIALKIELPGGRQSDFWLSTRLFGTTESENEFACPHVGVFPVGVSQLTISDCFGLFAFRRSMRGAPQNVAVLPNPVQTAPLPVSPGEGENSSAQRALSDHSIPEDIRAWQDGDELKRVHWKLSARRQSLMVHTYETPQRPDALILLDIAQPSGAARSALIDALTEGCAGTIESLLQAGRMTRLPLELSGQGELAGQGMESFDAMRRALAAAGYNRQDDFAACCSLPSPRMRRTRIGRRLFHAAHARHCGRGARAFPHGRAHALYAGDGRRNDGGAGQAAQPAARQRGGNPARQGRINSRQKGEFFHEKTRSFPCRARSFSTR